MLLFRAFRSTTRFVAWTTLGTILIFLWLTAQDDKHPSTLSKVSTKIPSWHPPFRIPSIQFGENGSSGKKVLVTGGSGVIGLPLVKRLVHAGFDVTMLDIRHPSDADLKYIKDGSTPSFEFASQYSEASLPNGKLHVMTADIRNKKQIDTLYKQAKTPFDGIIHLAGVARNTWCEEREEACHQLNVQGLKRVYDFAMESAATTKTVSPWFIYSSSVDVYGFEGKLGQGEMNMLGKTKRAAEIALKESHDKFLAQGDAPRTIVLRHSTTYGSPTEFMDRLLPATVARAMTDMSLQIMDADEKIDVMRIEDAIEGFMKAITKLEDSSAIFSGVFAEPTSITERDSIIDEDGLVANRAYWDEFNIFSGSSITPKELANVVMAATFSSSPIQDFSQTRERPGPYRRKLPDFDDRAESVLGFKAEVPIETGLAAYIHERQARAIDWAENFAQKHCPGSKYGLPNVLTESSHRNANMDRLMGCTINIGVNYDSWVHHMKCGETDGVSCQADNIKRNAYNWNQTVFTIIPAGTGVAAKPLNVSPRKQAPFVVQFQEEQTNMLLGFARKKDQDGKANKPVKFKLYSQDDVMRNNIVTNFEPRVQRNSSKLQLLVAGTDEVVNIVPQLTQTEFHLSTLTKDTPFDVRMTLLCCPTSQPWPLLMDDYEAADIKYGTTGDIPFESSLRRHECHRVEDALDFAHAKKKSLGDPDSDIQMHEEFSVDLALKSTAVKTTPFPHLWKHRDLPVCMNDCSSPTICVQNGHCRCIQADNCGIEERNPIAPIVVSAHSRLIKITTNEDFVKAVNKISWKDLLLPEAKRVIDEYPHMLKVHVVSGYDGEEEIEANGCHKLGDNHCFSADGILYKAMQKISVPPEEADLIILPAYQQCLGAGFLLHDIHSYAERTIPDFRNKPKSVILTHDWGICIAFAWNIWEARTQNRLYPDPLLDNIFVWSVQGDSNTKCYRPHQDIVIPARTCNSVKLKETFGDVMEITPAVQRTGLVTWSGTHWGTGKSTRLRLVCERGGAGEQELFPNSGAQSKWFDWRYMDQLRQSRFCPQPAGIAGWSFRVQDAIYAGCIPVFISDGTHYPFVDILDWSKISVRLSPTDLDHIEDILRAIPIEQVEILQANLVAIREAFLYSPDESPEDELKRQGPLFFAMHSVRIRLATRYPVSGT